ncbi:hypothetical protein CROQUDRAFT_660514 [Cronartium quercuum f. sp. fusiforme G11]|uniref:Uncharacterized protein n=1 Tax=Cronartium quercuum f. sp. fusiforme G11 TaxID=708437 RepID=A0A9P6NH89_9BASI|nr:hypothetical protein CROQUDRAFT_660514 [Cronartium quercuum f. sp. fusiforme G11]
MDSPHISQSSPSFFSVDQKNFPPQLAYPNASEPASVSYSTSSTVNQHTNQLEPRPSPAQSQPQPQSQSQSQSQSGPQSAPPANSLTNLGKDGDVHAVRRELNSLLGDIENLLSETDIVFSSIEQMYTSDPSPLGTYERIGALLNGYAKLANDFQASGFGGLPISPPYNLYSLLETKEREVQELYMERQKRREGSAIVMGVLQAPSTNGAVQSGSTAGAESGLV